MSEVPQYEPTQRFTNVQELYENHFRFTLKDLPDLTQYCQSVTLPSVTSVAIPRGTPFTHIREVGDHLDFSTFNVTFKMDAQMKCYNSIFWWMKGYGFPHSYDEVSDFRAKRQQQVMALRGRPQARDLEKTTGILSILQPDTETPIMEFLMTDVFPIALGELSFSTTTSDAPTMRCTATFALTDFDIYLPTS